MAGGENCTRCAELEEQVAWLKSELGESSDEALLASLQRRHGLTRTQARVLEVLCAAHGRTVPYRRLAELLGMDGDGDPADTLKVYAYHLRKKLGSEAVFTVWGTGLVVGPDGVAAFEATKALLAA